MKQRILTGIIAGAAYLLLLWIGKLPFAYLITLLGMIAFGEMIEMKKIKFYTLPGLIGLLLTGLFVIDGLFVILPITKLYLFGLIILFIYMLMTKNSFSFDHLSLLILSSLYTGFGFHLLIHTREESLALVLFIQLLIWATDSGAYFVGRKWGHTKLAPVISPKKTIEGSFGGLICALILGIIFQLISPVFSSIFQTMLVTLIISVFGQIGDLVESAIKRYYGVKDSGYILPGHGGVLDRFDSLIFILPILYLLQIIAH